MTYHIKSLRCDPTKLKGLSEKLIVSHYENKYGGAVKRLNAITEQLAALDFSKAPVFTINGLKREVLIASDYRRTPATRVCTPLHHNRPWRSRCVTQ